MKRNSVLYADLYRYEGERARQLRIKLRYFLFTPGYTFTVFFRLLAKCRGVFCRIVLLFLFHVTKVITGIQIPVGTEIGPGLKIGHFGNIVINPAAKIGRNFNIAQGCLIGNSQGKRAGVPVIGDNVVMGANSMVVGNAVIGNDVLIAPGAFVNFDVPDNSIVIGNPGKIIRRDSSPTVKYIVYSL